MRSTGAKSEETAAEENSRETYQTSSWTGERFTRDLKLAEQATANVTTTSIEVVTDWRPLRYATDEHNVTAKGGVNTQNSNAIGTTKLRPLRQPPPAKRMKREGGTEHAEALGPPKDS